MNKLPRLCAFDFIRCVAIILVIVHHFKSNHVSIVPESWSFNGFSLGSLGVSMFFILSGAALRYSDNGRYSFKRFIQSRFLSIFPMFWVGFMCAHFAYYLWFGGFTPFSGIPKWKLLFSLLACDGWLGFLGPNFCVIGEWFLGCILIVYLLYPMVRLLVDEMPVAALVIPFSLTLALADADILHIPPFTNPLFRIFEFSCGVAFSRWVLLSSQTTSKKRKRWWLLASTVFLAVGLFVSQYKYSATTFITIFSIGMAGFMVTYFVGDAICSERVKKNIAVLGRYSFAAFLCHHVIAGMLLSIYLSHGYVTECRTICLFLLYLVMVAGSSFVLYVIGNRLAKGMRKSRLFSEPHKTDSQQLRT